MNTSVDERKFGNTNLLEATADRPLVTFAVFAYNQEQFIREAVEGAFSQTYQPLEIILSDDCSPDRTHEVMREMASAYKGPHRVRLRRSEVNLGTALHVYAVSSLAQGSLLVVAAGDDISVPNRTSEMVAAWKTEGYPSGCLHSAASFFIDNPGRGKECKARTSSIRGKDKCLSFLRQHRLPFLSPTCAYSIDLFRSYGPILGGSIIEDGVMSVRSLLSGCVISIDQPLVLVRRLPKSAGTGYSIDDPARWNRFLLSRIISVSNTLRDIVDSDLDFIISSEIEAKELKGVARLAAFYAPASRPASFLWRSLFLLRYVFFYPTSVRIPGRLIDGLSFLGWGDLPLLVAVRRWSRIVRQ